MKKSKSASNYIDKRYVVIPGVIVDNEKLSATAKIIFGMIHAFKSEWNGVTVKYMSEVINRSHSTVQTALRDLKTEGLIEWKYRAKYRRFKSLLKKDGDAKSIIPFTVLNKKLGSTYKITYGMLVAAGLNELGAYNFNSVEELAKHLGLSDSSVYRHINKLLKLNTIRRDETSTWMFYTNDLYSRRKQVAIRRKQVARENKKNKHKWKTVDIRPDIDAGLNELANHL